MVIIKIDENTHTLKLQQYKFPLCKNLKYFGSCKCYEHAYKVKMGSKTTVVSALHYNVA